MKTVDISTDNLDAELKYIECNIDMTATIYIMEGKGAVSGDFEQSLRDKGYNKIVRIGGAIRYDTTGLIAENVKKAKNTPVILTSGESQYSILDSAVSKISKTQYPILYTNKTPLNGYTKLALNKIKPKKIFIIGNEKSISVNQVNYIMKQSKISKNQIVWIKMEAYISKIK